MNPYYDEDGITIWHGDARDLAAVWMAGAVMVTDPPFGRAWKQGELAHRSNGHPGIAGDADTSVRDAVLALWAPRPAIVFGDSMLAPPAGTRQVLTYLKPTNAGIRGATAGFRRDLEAVYLVGRWPSGLGGRSSLLTTRERSAGNPYSPPGRWNHPHAKPVDVMLELVDACPPGVIVDPFCGSGSTLVAAKRRGRRAVGVEVEAEHCEMAARRVRQGVLALEWGTA